MRIKKKNTNETNGGRGKRDAQYIYGERILLGDMMLCACACDPFWLPETKTKKKKNKKQTAITTDNIIPDSSSARINCLFYPLGCPIMTYKNQIPCHRYALLFCSVCLFFVPLWRDRHWKYVSPTHTHTRRQFSALIVSARVIHILLRAKRRSLLMHS